MSAKRKNALGRGLGALLNESESGGEGKQQFASKREERVTVSEIPISEIEVNPYQPRSDFDQEEIIESSIPDYCRRTPIPGIKNCRTR